MSYNFDGVDDWLGNATTAPVANGPLSAVCWFKPTSAGGHLINISDSTGNDNFRLSVNATSLTIRLNTVDNGTGDTVTSTTAAASTSDWNFTGFRMVSATERKLYFFAGPSYTYEEVNYTASKSPTVLSRLHIGSRRNSSVTDTFFTGQIAEVAVWNKELTDSEFISMSRAVSPKYFYPRNLVFYSPLIRSLVDYSVTSLTITNTGGATVSDHPRIYL